MAVGRIETAIFSVIPCQKGSLSSKDSEETIKAMQKSLQVPAPVGYGNDAKSMRS